MDNREKLQEKLMLIDEAESIQNILNAHEENPDNIVCILIPGTDGKRHTYLDDRSSKTILAVLRKLVATYKKEDAEFQKLVDKLVK